MTQNELDCAVAVTTGETVREIQRRGFSIVDDGEVNFDPEPYDDGSPYLDWDDLSLQRNVSIMEQLSACASGA